MDGIERECVIDLIRLLDGSRYKSAQLRGLCIKYKIMAVQPLNKRKIVKKITNKVKRFQSDGFNRVKVRLMRP